MGSFALRQGSDDGDKDSRDVSPPDLKRAYDPWQDGDKTTPGWKPGALPRGGEPRYAPKGDAGTKSPKAYEPTGKYAKIGGKGQRSGA